jgi:hypothetical protein
MICFLKDSNGSKQSLGERGARAGRADEGPGDWQRTLHGYGATSHGRVCH